jgi:hypothetical protein
MGDTAGVKVSKQRQNTTCFDPDWPWSHFWKPRSWEHVILCRVCIDALAKLWRCLAFVKHPSDLESNSFPKLIVRKTFESQGGKVDWQNKTEELGKLTRGVTDSAEVSNRSRW